MKVIANLLIWLSLVLGILAAATAYLPRVTGIDPDEGLMLAAPAGVVSSPADTNETDVVQPLLDPGVAPIVLDAATLRVLEDAGVERVRVKSFAWRRWTHRYYFLLSCVGLATGAWLVRRAQRLNVARSAEKETSGSPVQVLRQALVKVQALRGELEGVGAAGGRKRIVEVLDDLGRGEFDAFVQARPLLVGQLGIGGYAQVMDFFASAERQFNRAWSAAADHAMEEALECLAAGEARLRETQEQLAGGLGPGSSHPVSG